jgi:hypothetical protein
MLSPSTPVFEPSTDPSFSPFGHLPVQPDNYWCRLHYPNGLAVPRVEIILRVGGVPWMSARSPSSSFQRRSHSAPVLYSHRSHGREPTRARLILALLARSRLADGRNLMASPSFRRVPRRDSVSPIIHSPIICFPQANPSAISRPPSIPFLYSLLPHC